MENLGAKISSPIKEESKFTSRKFILGVFHCTAIAMLPIIYKLMGISDMICIAVLTGTSAVVSTYFGVNIIEKKAELKKSEETKCL